MLKLLGAQLKTGTLDGIKTDLLHSGQYPTKEVIVLLGIGLVKILLKLGIGYFIGRLKASIVRRILLDSIIGQVNLPLEVLYVKLVPTGPDIAFLEPVTLHDTMNVSDSHVVADVEFAFLVE